ncbi:unnamed protein product [Adineta ricciae]|uniref:F-box domain-containing protein n=1 Tax=Adineta ricciae TaxID=249248 RepID=A0A814RT51_ADIRI|nr:unnamed protein product [Adineta ricciae]CAF1420105.1 unnamed protein product [Adineta ricciae]
MVTIESLPNELWMMFFGYFNAHELYYHFNGLNARIDRLIRSVSNLCLKINENNYAYYVQHIMPRINFRNIQSLSFHSQSKTVKTTDFFLHYPLNRFRKLRSFVFHDWYLPLENHRQVIEQLPYLKILERLDIKLMELSMDFSDENNTRTIELIFNSSKNLRTSLKHVTLDIYVSNSMLPQISFLPTNIEDFQVSVMHVESFLKLTPSLASSCRTIQFKYLEGSHSNEVQLPPSTKVLSHCTKVTVKKTNCYFRFDHLKAFLSCLPEVKQLSIDNTCANEFITAEHLEFLLNRYCSKLSKFQYTYRDDPSYTFADFTGACKQSGYWSSGDVHFAKVLHGHVLYFDRKQ